MNFVKFTEHFFPFTIVEQSFTEYDYFTTACFNTKLLNCFCTLKNFPVKTNLIRQWILTRNKKKKKKGEVEHLATVVSRALFTESLAKCLRKIPSEAEGDDGKQPRLI